MSIEEFKQIAPQILSGELTLEDARPNPDMFSACMPRPSPDMIEKTDFIMGLMREQSVARLRAKFTRPTEDQLKSIEARASTITVEEAALLIAEVRRLRAREFELLRMVCDESA